MNENQKTSDAAVEAMESLLALSMAASAKATELLSSTEPKAGEEQSTADEIATLSGVACSAFTAALSKVSV
jgi:hypothetical protein